MGAIFVISITYLSIWWDFRGFKKNLRRTEQDADSIFNNSIDNTIDIIRNTNNKHNSNIYKINEIITRQIAIIEEDKEFLNNYSGISGEINSINIDLKEYENSLYDQFNMDKDVLEYLTGQIKISNTILKQTNETLSLKSNKIANVLEDILDIEKTVDNCILSQDLYNNMNKSYWDVDLTSTIKWYNDMLSANIET